MKKNKIYPEERLISIMKKLQKDGSVDVDSLSSYFGITGATIRSDLRELENRRLIIRTHGGAILKKIEDSIKPERDPSYESRMMQNLNLKEKIGAAVAGLLQNNDCIMLDDGSTTLQVAKHLPLDKKITVITNGLNICLELASHENVEVIATGGLLNKKDLSYHGRVAEDTARKFYANKAILGASGISIDYGVTTPDEMKAELKKVMIKNSAEIIIAADHTKLSKVSVFPVCRLEKITTLVTDSKTSISILEKFKASGIDIVIVEI